MKSSILITLLTIFVLIPGIVMANVTKTEFDVKKWGDSIIKERADKNEYFKTSPVSPMAGLLRETIESNEKLFVFMAGENIKISTKHVASPMLTILKTGSDWISIDNTGKEIIRNKSRETFLTDRFTFMCYPSEDKFTLIIFDPERKMITHFKHLLYYKPDNNFRVHAKLEKYKTTKERVVKTSRDLEKTLIEYGKVKFKINGKELSLTTFKFTSDKNDPNYKYLFLPFFDKTNLIDTYEAGRFLEVIEQEGDELIIDFNECYNPLCNYAIVYNCTLPPFENELDIEIKAGEKTYPH
ncbi:MAG: DUF1684 domain-containing protein [Candidatus Aminicenantes bacterium]|nr:DUF1684 domain-containing protein [Candidatus Aminicenantes bacterium]